MKELRRNMRIIGTLVILAFVVLCAGYALTVYTQGSTWASTAYNTRNSASNSLRGDITDRNGVRLAYDAPAWDISIRYKAISGNDHDHRRLTQLLGLPSGTVTVQKVEESLQLSLNPCPYCKYCKHCSECSKCPCSVLHKQQPKRQSRKAGNGIFR